MRFNGGLKRQTENANTLSKMLPSFNSIEKGKATAQSAESVHRILAKPVKNLKPLTKPLIFPSTVDTNPSPVPTANAEVVPNTEGPQLPPELQQILVVGASDAGADAAGVVGDAVVTIVE